MGKIIIGIVVMIAGFAYAIYQNKKMKSLNLDVQYTETSSISDAIDIVNDLSATDSNYRHYVELKGTVFTKERVTAPFTNMDVAYYCDTTYSVSEVQETHRDSNGNVHTRTKKHEEKLAEEHSPIQLFLRDSSYQEGICVDVESFGNALDLDNGCDRFEGNNSDWIRRNSRYVSAWGIGAGSKFLGYRLVEKVFKVNQPVYVLGELYATVNGYCVGKACVANKSSMLTYKSEDDLVAKNNNAAKMAWLIAAAGVAAGLYIIFFA